MGRAAASPPGRRKRTHEHPQHIGSNPRKGAAQNMDRGARLVPLLRLVRQNLPGRNRWSKSDLLALRSLMELDMPNDEELKRMAADPALSYWFRNALTDALNRDPVDAANDAGLLAAVLDKRVAELVATAGAQQAIQQASKR